MMTECHVFRKSGDCSICTKIVLQALHKYVAQRTNLQ